MDNMNNTNEGVSLSALSEGAIPTASAPSMPNKLPKLDPKSVKEADRHEVALPKASERIQEEMGNPMIDSAFASLDGAIERTREESLEILKKGEEQRIEESLDDDAEIDVSTSNNPIIVNKINPAPSTGLDDVSFDDEDEDEEVDFPENYKENEVINMNEVTPKETIEKETTPSVPVEEVVENTPTDTVDKPIKVTNTVATPNVTVNADVSDDDLKLLDDEDDDDIDSDKDKEAITAEIKEKIRVEIKEKFNPVSNKVDLSKFKVAKKPVSASKVINHIQKSPIEAADGVLYSIGRAVRMSAFSAIEIETLGPVNRRRDNYNSHMINRLRLIYNHLIDANKPSTFEAWAKSMTNDTINDYFFTAFNATFGRSNILTYTCSNDDCNNVFMEAKPIEDMIKFRNDEVKAKYMDILHSGNVNTETTIYEASLYQASDEYVFSLRKPSLYSTYIEPSLINEEFMKKYEDLMLLISYIDDIYVIDKTNNELIKIDTKPERLKPDVTVKRKIKTYATIIKSLTSDQLQALSVETDKVDDVDTDDNGDIVENITYVYPEHVCPKCGTNIPEQPESPDMMLFTRHQLGLMSKI